MRTYRNKRTGSLFTSHCLCQGEDWEEVKASAPKGKTGKKQELAADMESADGGTENP